MKIIFKQLGKTEIASLVKELGHRPYRASQLISWIYRKNAASFDDMTNVPLTLRNDFKRIALLNSLKLQKTSESADGSKKFLFRLMDGETIESVLIPNVRGKGLHTLCISSQVGCAMGCRFCETGRLGLIRNLRAHEIVDQVVSVRRELAISDTDAANKGNSEDNRIVNIVLMGMGEPLNNFNEVMKSLSIIIELTGFSKRKITLSTSGVVPGIRKFSEHGPPVNLAVSLNATTDETRDSIMPVNKKYPLKDLLKACREFPLRPNRRITFEYVLLGGVNDSEEDALRIPVLLRGIKSKINLIPLNPPTGDSEFKRPSEERVLNFQSVLSRAGMTVIVRKSSGDDISAACGQLRASYIGSK